MKSLLGLLALGTVANIAIGWATNAPPQPLDASGLPLPSPAPGWMLEATSAAPSACKLVVVVRHSCPFCQQAAEKASTSGTLAPSTTWVAAGVAEADSFRVAHPNLSVVSQGSVMSDLVVRGVPAAFVVRGDSIIDSWGFRGTEAEADLARLQCEADPAGGVGP